MPAKQDLAVVAFATPGDFEAWLAEHHRDSPDIWLKLAKRDSVIPSVTYDEALDVALCYGWIDGQKDSVDENWSLQRFTPRRPNSKWSQRNARRSTRSWPGAGCAQPVSPGSSAPRPTAGGTRRTPAVDRRRTRRPSGRAGRQRQRPRVLRDPRPANRYAILDRVQDAKKPETRAKRIETFVAMLANGEKLHR